MKFSNGLSLGYMGSPILKSVIVNFYSLDRN